MNKSSLKNFAIEARRELMGNIERKLNILGITKKGIVPGNSMGSQIEIGGRLYNRDSYDALIRKYSELGYDELIEESGYTWFNRLTALAYMECNGYIDEKIIFSTTSKTEPNIIDEYNDAEFFQNFDRELQEKIHDLRDNHKLEEMYSILVEGKCEELSVIMPFMFSKRGGYAELLFPSGLLMDNSILVKLRKEMAESKEENGTVPVELIGWLYQFYNSEKKDEVFEGLKKNQKITKENIPAATQLFTPKWIVKYMAENSLGKLAVESLGVSEDLKKTWKYYIESEKDESAERVKIEDLKILDPAMGSGHMLTYSFDLLFDIYEDLGWGKKDAVISILKNNIFGLEIDERAGQLASFAIMMKGREKFPRLFKVLERLDEEERFNIHTLTIQESNTITEQTRKLMAENSLKSLEKLLENFHDAKEYGSILKLEKIERENLEEDYRKLKEVYDKVGQISLFNSSMELTGSWNMSEDLEKIEKLIDQQEIMTEKYDVVITNPPYMGGKGYSDILKKYVEKNYKDSKADLFAVFMEKNENYCKRLGFISMVTMNAWMFLSSYEELRKKMIENQQFISILHLGMEAFEAIIGKVVQTVAWVTKNRKPVENFKLDAVRLVDYYDARRWEKEEQFFNPENRYQINQKDFEKIPGSPIAYWISQNMISLLGSNSNLSTFGNLKSGTSTNGKNEELFRFWNEVSKKDIQFDCYSYQHLKSKWLPLSKGGEKRRYYGNNNYIVEKEFCRDDNLEYEKAISWSDINSTEFSARVHLKGMIANNVTKRFYPLEGNFDYILGLMNTKQVDIILKYLIPTLHFDVGYVGKIPVLIPNNLDLKNNIKNIVRQNISISKQEWDSRETSWDFEESPLIKKEGDKISNPGYIPITIAVEKYCDYWREQFVQMHKNEEELNRLFIEIYGLQDEMDEKVDFEDITLLKKEVKILKIDTLPSTMEEIEENEKTPEGYLYNRGVILEFDKEEIMKQFLSYAVGCIMGRYSIDKLGLVIANSDDEMVVENNKIIIKGADGEIRHEIENPRFIPDAHGIVPVVKEDIFENDIVERVVEFIKVVYGETTLEDNLNFIAEALGKKNSETSRDVLRKYFIKDFYKDHLQRYKKRPIYWMMNSGKKDAFSALIYLHRYEENSIGRVRADYLIPYQETLDNQRAFYERIVSDKVTTPKDRKDAEKKLKELDAELKELRDYANEVKHIADQKISLDLDDGVKVNYEKFGKILGKI